MGRLTIDEKKLPIEVQEALENNANKSKLVREALECFVKRNSENKEIGNISHEVKELRKEVNELKSYIKELKELLIDNKMNVVPFKKQDFQESKLKENENEKQKVEKNNSNKEEKENKIKEAEKMLEASINNILNL